MYLPLPIRSQIRARATELLGVLPPFKGHVFNARNPVLRRDLLPAVRIYVDRDQRTSELNAQHMLGMFTGTMGLIVQVVCEAGADPATADNLDQYCALVETALLSDGKFLKLAPVCDAIETTVDLDVQGEYRTAIGTMEFALRYSDCVTRVFDDDLLTIRLKLDLVDPPADPNTAGHPTEPPDGYPGGYPGPDGRIELEAEWSVNGRPWDEEEPEGPSTWDDGKSTWPY